MSEHESGLDERFASLEEASRNLSTDVTGLTKTLVIVADLQRQQRDTRLRQEKTEADIESARLASAERDRRTRGVIRMVATALGILLPVVAILVYWSLLVHVDDLIAQQQRDRYTSCTMRNQVPLLNALREDELAKLEPDPKIKAVHTHSAQALRNSVVDCTKYLPKATS